MGCNCGIRVWLVRGSSEMRINGYAVLLPIINHWITCNGSKGKGRPEEILG